MHNADCGSLAEKIANNYHSFPKHRGDLGRIGITTREQFAQHIQDIIDNGVQKVVNSKTAYWKADANDSTKGWVVWHDPKNTYEGGSCYPMTKAKFDAL